jgi:hypothetical protein
VGVVGEILDQFWEYVDRCSRLEAVGLGVCNLILGSAGDETNLAARLEEGTGQLRLTRGGQGALGDLTSQARGLVQREPDGVPPLAVVLTPSSVSRPSETQVSVVTLNVVRWGAVGADRHPITLP